MKSNKKVRFSMRNLNMYSRYNIKRPQENRQRFSKYRYVVDGFCLTYTNNVADYNPSMVRTNPLFKIA